ncbi:DUF309 domain-containing protein [Neobacillus sp. D3-1R]|uniref:DUF309 domain-containing protein n=1 Tax=Neobacillus sp. D3-1R TaxID=3445778 RepID=UPI003FA0CB57
MLPNAFVKYLYHFHVDRDYFECHEILEDFWKQETNQEKNSIWVGLILLAVANYHHRRQNFPGAIRTLEKAINILYAKETELTALGIDSQLFFEQLDTHLTRIRKKEFYESYSLPLFRQVFIDYFPHYDPCSWGKKSDLSNEYLVNRHKLRDRSDVIKEREKAIYNRKKKDSE